ncbi:hypothetical protein N5J06_22670 [Ralstonia sp. CHL-2022]|uniref:Uncharacterized protein n=1 Tax=Ralstonia mojiangensis TaxID=2953895 RepID=A0ABT2LF44_9RALS|nr:hypothetical protein [Ralstonia mojiangensis]MCT7313784.1 hypothetical protein [Ralstonia mojiangensis]
MSDALDTIATMPARTRGSALLTVAEAASIPAKEKAKLAQQALDAARATPPGSLNSIRSRELAHVALYYSAHGDEPTARAIFDESLNTAQLSLGEQGSGGYRQVTDAMAREPVACKAWTVSAVAKRLQADHNATNTAFAYKDLAKVATALGDKPLAANFIRAGVAAAEGIDQSSARKRLIEDFARVAVDADYTASLPEEAPDTLAIKAMRAGNPQKALSIISGLSEGLYVSQRETAFQRVLDDAIKRDDLSAALYLAEHPVKQAAWTQASTWRRVAEMQIKHGSKNDAANSYSRAENAATAGLASPGYLAIEEAVALSDSLRQSGFGAEARRVALSATSRLQQMPTRNVEDRVKAGKLISEMLWRQGMRAQAQRELLDAYRAAETIPSNQQIVKARLMTGVGMALSTFAADGAIANQSRKGAS